MPKTIKVRAEIVVPRVPSFLRIANAGDAVIDVADLRDDSLKEIGEAFTVALIDHARMRRKITNRRTTRIPKDAAEVVP